jgi:hypothetical protein
MNNFTSTTLASLTSEVATETFAPSPLQEEFHWCRHLLPQDVLIASTVVSALLSLFMLNAMCGMTFKYSRIQLRRLFFPTERKISFIQYALIAPMFELFVIWGDRIGVSTDTDSASIVVTWVTINVLCLFVMLCSCRAQANYRLLIRDAQTFRFPMSVMFLCDRAFNSVIGIECIFIVAIMLFSVFEFFHVQDYFAVFRRPSASRGFASMPDDDVDDKIVGVADNKDDEIVLYNYGGEWLNKNRADNMSKEPERDRVAIDLSTSDKASTRSSTKKAAGATAAAAGQDGLLPLSDDEEDGDAAGSLTDVENVSPNVLATLQTQERSSLINKLLKQAMKCTDQTDPESIKRAVLKFKTRVLKTRPPSNRASSSGDRTHDSGF